MLLLHFTKHPTPTQRLLNLVSMLMKIFRIEDSMLFVAKNLGGGGWWGDNESKSQKMMI
jgi:hypothetical protein